jgi:IS30 family transposase
VKANGGRNRHRISTARLRALDCAKRPKTRKLSYALITKRFTEDLEKLWSPEEIALRLTFEFPEETRVQLSRLTCREGTNFAENRPGICVTNTPVPGSSSENRSRRQHNPNLRAISRGRGPYRSGHWEGDLIIGARGACVFRGFCSPSPRTRRGQKVQGKSNVEIVLAAARYQLKNVRRFFGASVGKTH